MKVTEAYKILTEERKRQAVKDINVLLKSNQVSDSAMYVKHILNGNRTHPCSVDAARLISGYFTGIIGVSVTVDDVLCCFKPTAVGLATAPLAAAA